MRETILGLFFAALTGLVLLMMARRRYKCPHCGRIVKWTDEHCPHCGDDMQFRHRIGPPQRIKSRFDPIQTSAKGKTIGRKGASR